MAIDTRPTSLTAVHNYNLRNQGWPTEATCAFGEDATDVVYNTDPVVFTYERRFFYPSNADVFWAADVTSADDVEAIGAYSPWVLEKETFGNTPAPKGHFIINAFDKNREAVSGIETIYDPDIDKTDDRPISVAFYTGRIWYLMPDGVLYFSQVLTEIKNAQRCYQEADPTAEDINELVATDGGELDISGVSQGLKLIPIRAELALIADNGVWTISGEQDAAFSATNQEIRKITSVGAQGPETVLEAEGTIFYWSEGGIYALVANEITGLLEAQNIIENNILSFYHDISIPARKNARGFYDEADKKIFWLYNDTADYDGTNWRYNYNRALVLDVVLGAWYTYTFDSSGNYPHISSMFEKAPGSTSTTEEIVTDGGATVTSSGVDVTQSITVANTSDVALKFLTFVEESTDVWSYTISELRDNTLTDWVDFDNTGVDFSSYLETGHDIFEDLISEKEAGTIYTFFKRTEMNFTEVNDVIDYDFPSGCLMRAKWQWADSETSGRWSDQQQVYRLQRHYIPSGSGTFDYGYEVIQTINQVRGKGRALSLRFDSETGKDFHLLGWSIPVSYLTGE